jgi:hypothetical protein
MRRQDHSTPRGRRPSRPAWWLVYAIAVLFVAAVGLAEMLIDGQGLRKILEVVAVVAGFGLIGVWLRHNRIALDLQRARRRT